MQRHDYAIVRCVTYERAPEWSYGGEVGGHRVRVFALAKLNETNSELQRLKGWQPWREWQMTDLTISGWALKPHREFSVYFFKKQFPVISQVGELTKCFLRGPIFGRSGSNHELFSQSFWYLPFVMFSGKRQMSYETVRTKSALVKFISFVLRALPRIMPSESTWSNLYQLLFAWSAA